MKTLAAALALSFVLVFALSASASGFTLHDTKKMSARQLLVYGKHEVKHARDLLGFLSANPAAGTHRSRVRLRRDSHWLLRVGRRNLAVAHAHTIVHVSLPWAFWDCVATGLLNGARVSSGEGGATSVDPSGTYFGRYQMDWGFMHHWGADMLQKYGGRPATSWSVADQTIVAERGFSGYHGEQGQGPGAWPHTAWPCLSLR